MDLMKSVSIRELKDGFASYMREVAEGARFRITNHGQAVAVLGPDVEEPAPIPPRIGEVIGGRLVEVHRLLNASPRRGFCPARMAAIMEMPRPVDLERLMRAEDDVTFEFLDRFADTFAASRDWIRYGVGAPFEARRSDTYQSGESLLQIVESANPKTLYFVKDTSDACRATIVAEVEPHRFRVIFEPIHVSSQNGNGGAGRLVSFFDLVTLLQGRSTRWSMTGVLVSPEAFDALLGGSWWPGKVCLGGNQSTWWDDFTDISGKYPISSGYASAHGKAFVDAQEIVRYHQKERNERDGAIPE